jgi:flagellar basal body rod protein FlgF
MKSYLDVEPREIDLDISHDGYLFLATKKTTEKMIKNHKIQL